MSGSSQTVVAHETLTSGTTMIGAAVTTIASGALANDGTPTISAAIYVPIGVDTTITNTSLIEISGASTQDRVRSGAFNPIYYNEGIGLEIIGQQSTVINTGSIISETTLSVPNGVLSAYTVYGIALSVQVGKAINEKAGLISGSGDGAYLVASTMTNYGTVEGHQGRGNTGVVMQASGLDNAAGGLIAGGQYGVYERTFAIGGHLYGSTLLNQGVIEATGFQGRGVGVLVNGGPFTNAQSGTVIGYGGGATLGYGAVIGFGETMTNDGLITVSGPGIGVFITNGTLINGPGAIATGVEVGFSLGSGVLINDGSIAPQVAGFPAVLLGSGSATNTSTGVIVGTTAAAAIGFYSASADLLNQGLIEQVGTVIGAGDIGKGVYLYAGAFTNAPGATLTGYDGLAAGTAAVTLVNDGLIVGKGTQGIGVTLSAGSLLNAGVIGGTTGIMVGGSASVAITDSGVIGANNSLSGAALTDAHATLNLTLDPGATLLGAVNADQAAGSSLLLAAGPNPGVLGTLGQTIAGFATISLAASATWTVTDAAAALTTGQTIEGFSHGDTLILDGFAATSDIFLPGTGLELSNGVNTLTLDLTGNFTTSDFTVTDPPTSTTIALANPIPCFLSGTGILTPHGARPVESLRIGDQVIRHDGAAVPIQWLGQRRIDTSRHPCPELVWPVVIRAHAIADGIPARDLYVSPDHALYLDGHLIPAKTLLNGGSIHRVRRRFVTYHHIELADHAALYAEQCLAESYLDTGNRGCFIGADALSLHPRFDQDRRERSGFAPFACSGPPVEAVRARLLTRAAIPVSHDPHLRLLTRADGSLLISSRSAIPGHLAADPRDQRRLGVKLAGLTIDDQPIALDHTLLTDGWHDPEPDGRWTDGAALIPAALLQGGCARIALAATLAYPAARRRVG